MIRQEKKKKNKRIRNDFGTRDTTVCIISAVSVVLSKARVAVAAATMEDGDAAALSRSAKNHLWEGQNKTKKFEREPFVVGLVCANYIKF